MKLRFTDLAVSRLKEIGEYHDEMTPGFAIRVVKNRKTWFVIRGRDRLRKNVGQYPTMSLADARKDAKKLLTETPTKNDRVTFSGAYEEWKEAIKSRKPRTQSDYKRMMGKLD